MSKSVQTMLLSAGLMLATVSFAEAPAGAPAGATGMCKDGTYWTNAQKRGACHGHKGVQSWYGAADADSGAAATAPTRATTAAPAEPAAPAAAPAGATGMCKDGTYWTNAQKRGACHGHKGVQSWYGAADAGSGAAAAAPTRAATPAPAEPAAPAAAPRPAAAPPSHAGYTPAAAAAPGGGAGMVWVNGNTKVYHCPADRWYGKTKNGAYMSEADAKAQGDRPDHGRACR